MKKQKCKMIRQTINNEHIHNIDINDITVNDQSEHNNTNQQADKDLSK